MIKRISIVLAIIFLVGCKSTQIQTTKKPVHISLDRKQYISEYSDLAVREMKRTGVPASITLAQALLESDNGNSTLATNGNNHFGIKCHKSWDGKKIYHDDDKRGECFRKYPTVYDSYIDHSNFLLKNRIYSSLFDLDQTDYKAWARGLQKAGYATSKTYATNLIRIIEDNQLYVYDKGGSLALLNNTPEPTGQSALGDIDNFSIEINNHTIHNRNRIDYIIVKKGDTFKSLEQEFDLIDWELKKYNELSDKAELYIGQILYLQPKRNKAEVGNDYHKVSEGETMYLISQMYGIKLKQLYDKNLMRFGTEPKVGDKLYLRKVKPLEEVDENAVEYEEEL